MADTKPLKIDAGRTQQFGTGDTVPIANGGTGATTAANALTALGAAPTASPTFTGASKFPDGSAAAPSIANSDHTGTGVYFGTNTLSVSTAGVSRGTWNADGSFTNQAGSSGTIAVLGTGPAASPTYAELGSAAYASLSQAQDQTSIGWKDMLAPVSGALPPPSSAPSKTLFGPSGNRYEYAFAVNEHITIQPFHVNHDILPGARAYLHVHWSTDGTNTQPVRWEMEVMRAKGHNQANFAAPVTITLPDGTPHGTAWRHYVTEVTNEADVLILTEPDEQILVVLKRVTNGGTDNTDDVFATQVDIHYESRIHHTPNKAPNFYGET